MTKTKLKQISLDAIHQYLEENKEDIIDLISMDAVDIDEDGETVPVDMELIDEAFDDIMSKLF
ncbi:hypothetical protein UFOVP760_45 [uncultured Caudovirales phage]|uniref:Uncharacterized protein n=1 Tax=uncultured Caudovirales phage TaxID=2100421 RepID=A0A6J7X6K9_9CAUD|nr:hypothetical protein UFOVP760_45 [uncultured Caudovirales phage]